MLKIFPVWIAIMLALTACTNIRQNATPEASLPVSKSSTPTHLAPPTATKTLLPTSGITLTPSPTAMLEMGIPDNSLIVYSTGNSIDAISPKGGNPISIAKDPLSGTGPDVFYYSPSWSPDGNKIAFALNSTANFNIKLYTLNKDGSNLLLLRDNIRNLGDPTWSPAGEYIAYTSDQAGTNYGSLYITDADGTGLRQLIESTWLLHPAWSPDGKKLAVLSPTKRIYGPNKISLIDSDGKNLHPITDAIAGLGKLAWSPDGTKIAFRSFDDCGDINVLDLTTGTVTNLTNTPGISELDPAWSADGHYIAFIRNYDRQCNQEDVSGYPSGYLFVMNTNGQNVRQISNVTGYQPAWWPTLALQINWKYRVTKAGANLNIRETASTSAKSLSKLPAGEILTILEGPVDADNYRWWRIRTNNGVEGWCVDVPGWFVFESTKNVQQ